MQKAESVIINGRPVPLFLVPSRKARRYVLSVKSPGIIRVAIPRGGAQSFAREFARQNLAWIEKKLASLQARPARPGVWLAGTEILFCGEKLLLRKGEGDQSDLIFVGDQALVVPPFTLDYRPHVEEWLWQKACRELPVRVLALAKDLGIAVAKVSIKNQRSRWGSCSTRRSICLNWRLIHAPGWVADYVILHELMHLREMNHSNRFWKHVADVCPEYQAAEAWLKAHPINGF